MIHNYDNIWKSLSVLLFIIKEVTNKNYKTYYEIQRIYVFIIQRNFCPSSAKFGKTGNEGLPPSMFSGKNIPRNVDDGPKITDQGLGVFFLKQVLPRTLHAGW